MIWHAFAATCLPSWWRFFFYFRVLSSSFLVCRSGGRTELFSSHNASSSVHFIRWTCAQVSLIGVRACICVFIEQHLITTIVSLISWSFASASMSIGAMRDFSSSLSISFRHYYLQTLKRIAFIHVAFLVFTFFSDLIYFQLNGYAIVLGRRTRLLLNAELHAAIINCCVRLFSVSWCLFTLVDVRCVVVFFFFFCLCSRLPLCIGRNWAKVKWNGEWLRALKIVDLSFDVYFFRASFCVCGCCCSFFFISSLSNCFTFPVHSWWKKIILYTVVFRLHWGDYLIVQWSILMIHTIKFITSFRQTLWQRHLSIQQRQPRLKSENHFIEHVNVKWICY